MAARCRLSLRYHRGAAQRGVDVRSHSATLYASIFRFDDVALINSHIYGLPATEAPTLHISQVAGGRLFAQYLESVRRVWENASAIQ